MSGVRQRATKRATSSKGGPVAAVSQILVDELQEEKSAQFARK